MSVFQIEQYYIHLEIGKISGEIRSDIEKVLTDNFCSSYEFCDTYLIVDNFEAESDASNVEKEILNLIN